MSTATLCADADYVRLTIQQSAEDGGTLFNPDVLVKEILASRPAEADAGQTRDYVLFCIREAPHVCRHQYTPGLYRIHTEPECSPACKEKARQEQRTRRGPTCTTCFLPTTVTGACGCE